jgi:alpha-beta hydrolase superfamily lysophospholipase
MGSFLARTYLIRYPGTVDGTVIMGTGQMSPALISGGLAVAAVEGRRIGEENASALVSKLSFETYNKVFAPNRTGFDWLSVNEANVDAYIADPLCGGNASIGLFREMLGGMRFIAKPEQLKKMNLNTPILFISGGMDPVGDCGKGVQRAYDSFRKAGVRDVSLKLYPNLRHEILCETERETVFADIYEWLASKC